MTFLLALAALATPSTLDPLDARLAPPLRSAEVERSVRVVLEGAEPERLALRARGLPGVVIEHVAGGQVQLVAPGRALRELAGLPGVARVGVPHEAIEHATTTEGLDLLLVQDWHALGLTGAGVKVAVIDTGFSGLDALRGTDAPDTFGWTCLDSRDTTCGASTHGTAVVEVVHDMAPDAELHLFGARLTTEFLAAIEAIRDGDFDVVTCSIGFGNFVPGDGSGTFAAAIDAAVASSGALWFQAAGNQNLITWSGVATDADTDGWLELGGSEVFPVQTGAVTGSTQRQVLVDLRWDDTWGGATRDLDLVLDARDAIGNAVSCSFVGGYTGDGPQSGQGAHVPWERIEALCPAGTVARVQVTGAAGAGRRLWVVSYPGLDASLRSNAHSIATPGDAASVITVGAVGIDDLGIRTYSGRGPTDDGRVKPDFVGPSPVSVTSRSSFSGTSAATPHLAGLAALVVQDVAGRRTRAQILDWIADEAMPLGDPGQDNRYGWGLPQLDAPWFGDGVEPVDPVDTDEPDDTGRVDTGVADTDDTGGVDPDATGGVDTDDTGRLPQIGECTCASGPRGGGLVALLGLLFLRRRR